MTNNDLHFAKRLSDIIKCKTISSLNESLVDFNEFFKLHNYLEKEYPLVHKTFKKEVIGNASLIYHWKCEKPTDILPLALLSHIDVVSDGDESQWTYPPFSGHIEDGFLWGRGATDMKAHVIAYMETLEGLIKEGFKPNYDIYICYGENEEVLGDIASGAETIVNTLYERGVRFGCSFDEGGYVIPGDFLGINKQIAAVALGEKGYADFEISTTDTGGHSSMPPVSTSLGKICKAGFDIEQNLMNPRITDYTNLMVKTLSPYLDEKYSGLINTLDNPDALKKIASSSKPINGFVRTTTTLTMAKGSNQPNVLPERASLIVNSRILPGDTIDDVYNHIKNVVDDDISIKLIGGNNPPTPSPLDSVPLKILEDLIGIHFPCAAYVPIVTVCASDSRFYHKICDNVFRFFPFYYDKYLFTAHKVNERIPIEGLWTSVEFFTDFIKKYNNI